MIKNKIYKKLNPNLKLRVYNKLFKYVKINQQLVINQLKNFFHCLNKWTPPAIEAYNFYEYLGYIKLLYLIKIICPDFKHKNIIRYWTNYVLWQYKL